MEIAVLELILNALEHGAATRTEVNISRDRVEIRDNGHLFDPTCAEPALRDGRGAGLWFFKKFCEKYHGVMRPHYRVEALENIVELNFDTPLRLMTHRHSCMHFVPGQLLFGGGYERAMSVPIGGDCEVFTCVFERDLYALSISFLFVFLRTLVRRLPAGGVLVVELPSGTDLLRETIEELCRLDGDLASRIRVGT